MKLSTQQIALINNIAQEIGWWKQGLVTQQMIEEFVRHELSGLTPDQENQIINSLSKIIHVIKQVE